MRIGKCVLVLLFALLISVTAFAQPRLGDKVPEFQLQGTDGRSYQLRYSDDRVSVLFFVGYS